MTCFAKIRGSPIFFQKLWDNIFSQRHILFSSCLAPFYLLTLLSPASVSDSILHFEVLRFISSVSQVILDLRFLIKKFVSCDLGNARKKSGNFPEILGKLELTIFPGCQAFSFMLSLSLLHVFRYLYESPWCYKCGVRSTSNWCWESFVLLCHWYFCIFCTYYAIVHNLSILSFFGGWYYLRCAVIYAVLGFKNKSLFTFSARLIDSIFYLCLNKIFFESNHHNYKILVFKAFAL